MTDINLLPEELREKEEKERESVRKQPKIIRIPLSSPTGEKNTQPLTQAKPSLLSRLFSRKTVAGKPIAAPEEPTKPKKEDAVRRDTEKIVEIPKAKSEHFDQGGATPYHGGQRRDYSAAIPSSVGAYNADSGRGMGEEKLHQPTEKIIEIKDEPRIDLKQRPTVNLLAALLGLFGGGKKSKRIRGADLPTSLKGEKKHKDKENRQNLDVNLMPEDVAAKIDIAFPKKFGGTITTLLVVGLFIAGSYVGLLWYQNRLDQQIEAIEKDIHDLDAKITSAEVRQTEIIDLQERLKLIRELLENHMYWTKFFEMLEQNTIQEVYYTNFSMTGTDRLILSAIGRDFSSAAKQMVVFQNAKEFISDVRIDAVSGELDQNDNIVQTNFNIVLTIAPGVFTQP